MLKIFCEAATVSLPVLFVAVLTLLSPTAIAGDVTLAWDASPSPNVGGYRVHYGLSSGIYPNKVFVGNQTSYTLSGLKRGKTYYISVTAHEAIGFDESEFSNEVSVDVPFLDSDGDGMPNRFETANGLDPLDPADASEDLDGDEFTNLQEFKAGTDPNDPASNAATVILPIILQILLDAA